MPTAPNHPPIALDHPGRVSPHPDDDRAAVLAWQRHLDAGRIGERAAEDPAVAASLAAADALFRSFGRVRPR